MEFRLRPWGADGDLVALLGEQGAAEFRALFDAFPDPVGVLWALRDETGAIVDFAFGYGNLAMLAGFRLPRMLGTFVQRVAKLGDGLIVFLVDVTAERRMEAELQAYANLVAHDLSEPLASMQLLVTLLEQHPDTPPSPEVLRQLRASARRRGPRRSAHGHARRSRGAGGAPRATGACRGAARAA